jgi:hypothetical protein
VKPKQERRSRNSRCGRHAGCTFLGKSNFDL